VLKRSILPRVINKTFYLAKKKDSSKVTESGYFHSWYFYLLKYFQVFANLITKNLHITFYDLNKQFNHPNQGWMQGKNDVKINICRNLDAITTTSGEFLGASPLSSPLTRPKCKISPLCHNGQNPGICRSQQHHCQHLHFSQDWDTSTPKDHQQL
jgi:hypothetical protein